MPVILMGGTFSPLSIAGLSAWYAARLETIYNDNDTLTSVSDRSGNGRNLTTIVSTPKWRSSGINSVPSFQAAGGTESASRLNNPSTDYIAAAAGTVFCVFRFATWATIDYPWILTEIGVAQRANVAIFSATTFAGQNNDGVIDTTGNNTVAVNNNYISTWHHEAGTLYSGINDTRTASMTSIASGNTTSAAGDDMCIIGSSGGAASIDGYIAEVLMWNVALTQAQRQTVESWLASIYGITLPY